MHRGSRSTRERDWFPSRPLHACLHLIPGRSCQSHQESLSMYVKIIEHKRCQLVQGHTWGPWNFLFIIVIGTKSCHVCVPLTIEIPLMGQLESGRRFAAFYWCTTRRMGWCSLTGRWRRRRRRQLTVGIGFVGRRSCGLFGAFSGGNGSIHVRSATCTST